MFTSGSAFKIYIKYTALFIVIITSLVYVFAPIVPTVMNLMGFNSFFGMEFTGKTEKTYVNVLLMGVDKSETLSDVMMVAQLNIANNSVNILQIPRDTYIQNKRSDKKLNSAFGFGGAEKTIEELKTVIDIEIDDYVLVTTSGFRDVIDAVGGIYYDIPEDMNYKDPTQDLYINLKKGYQLLDGDKAEQFVRFRAGYATGDLGRIDAQSGFIKEAMRQIIEKNASNSEEETQKLISTVSGMLTTSFSFSEMLKYAPYVLGINTEDINIMRLEGEAQYKGSISYFIADNEKNKQLIFEYFSPDISEADLSEIKARDNAIGKQETQIPVTQTDIENVNNNGISVYLMDYSATDGKTLEKVRKHLEDMGYNIIGSIEARTCSSDKTYSISKQKSKLLAKVSHDLGLDTYMVNENLQNDADVVVIIGKDL